MHITKIKQYFLDSPFPYPSNSPVFPPSSSANFWNIFCPRGPLPHFDSTSYSSRDVPPSPHCQSPAGQDHSHQGDQWVPVLRPNRLTSDLISLALSSAFWTVDHSGRHLKISWFSSFQLLCFWTLPLQPDIHTLEFWRFQSCGQWLSRPVFSPWVTLFFTRALNLTSMLMTLVCWSPAPSYSLHFKLIYPTAYLGFAETLQNRTLKTFLPVSGCPLSVSGPHQPHGYSDRKLDVVFDSFFSLHPSSQGPMASLTHTLSPSTPFMPTSITLVKELTSLPGLLRCHLYCSSKFHSWSLSIHSSDSRQTSF